MKRVRMTRTHTALSIRARLGRTIGDGIGRSNDASSVLRAAELTHKDAVSGYVWGVLHTIKSYFCKGILVSHILMLGANGVYAAESSPNRSRTYVPVEACQISAHSVIVTTRLGRSCIRYAASSGVQGAAVAIISFHGDRDPQSEVKKDFKAVEIERIKDAQQFADRYRQPWIMIARPGVYGSSGDHWARRELLEFLTIDAAISAIKARYGIKHLVLVGHSGGATAVGALLTLGREDILCAVMTSGAFSLLERQARRSAATGRNYTNAERDYDPLTHIPGIRRSNNRKIYIAGDPRDSNTHFDLQQLFADKVRLAGHEVEVVRLKGVPPAYHNIGTEGLKLAADCARERASQIQ